MNGFTERPYATVTRLDKVVMGSETVNGGDTKNDADLLNKSTKGASFLMMTQLFTKMLTFLLNQLLIRLISPRVFGISAYLEFVISMVLFFSREGARLSIQRTRDMSGTDDKAHDKKDRFVEKTQVGTLQSIINFGYIPLIVGFPLSILILVWQYYSQVFQESLLTLPYYTSTIVLVWLLMILELGMEPLYAVNQFKLNFGRRSRFESVGVFGRCLVTFAVIALLQRVSTLSNKTYDGLAVFAFALGQFGYSFLLFAQYQWSFAKENKSKPVEEKNSLVVQKIYSRSDDTYFYFDSSILSIWKSLFVLMLFKHFLTEGDKLLINYLCTVEEQGTYAVVSNYGSIIARLLFQPIEESLRLLFTRMLSTKSESNIKKSYEVMHHLGIFYIYLSILIGIAGYTNSAVLLKILLGGKASKWSQTGIFDLFPQYVLYIPFLAFNGILEAFFNSVANGRDIKRFSLFMSFLTLVVLLSLYIFIAYFGLGLSGLVLANTVNMLLRIIYCTIYITSFYSTNGVTVSFMNGAKRIRIAILCGTIFVYLQYLALGYKIKSSSIVDVIKSASLCFVYLAIMIYYERDLLKTPYMEVRNKFLTRRKTSKLE